MAELVAQSTLLMLQEVMGEEYPQLLDAFLQDAQYRYDVLVKAHAEADAEVFWQMAHSFKGSCSNLGAHGLALLCGELELHGRQLQWQGSELLLERLARELAAVHMHLRAERQRYLLRSL